MNFLENGVAATSPPKKLGMADKFSSTSAYDTMLGDEAAAILLPSEKETDRITAKFGAPSVPSGTMRAGGLDTPYQATAEFDPDANTVDVSWEMGDAFEASLVMLVRKGNAVRWSYADQPASGDGGSFRFTDVDLRPGEYQIVVWSFSDGMTNTGRLSSGVLAVISPGLTRVTLSCWAPFQKTRGLERRSDRITIPVLCSKTSPNWREWLLKKEP